MQTKYAKAYQRLVDVARSNHITMVLASFSMAVNSRSETPVVEFYRRGFPSVYAQIAANEIHSRLVREIAETNHVRFVDTQPGLDGQHESFIDLIHLTQEGRQRMAETMFSGISDLVKAAAAPPK